MHLNDHLEQTYMIVFVCPFEEQSSNISYNHKGIEDIISNLSCEASSYEKNYPHVIDHLLKLDLWYMQTTYKLV